MAATFPEHYRYVMAQFIAESESLLITFAFTTTFTVRSSKLFWRTPGYGSPPDSESVEAPIPDTTIQCRVSNDHRRLTMPTARRRKEMRFT